MIVEPGTPGVRLPPILAQPIASMLRKSVFDIAGPILK